MSVLFDNIPGNIRVPFFHAEFRAGGTPYTNNARGLIIGQKLSTGIATAGVPILVRADQAVGLGGIASMIAQMDKAHRKTAPLGEVWWLPVADNGSGVAATGKISVAAPSGMTTTETMVVYIGGRRVDIPVATTDTRTDIAADLIAKINATADMPVVATVDGTNAYEVVLTARHKGTLGNAIMIEPGIKEQGEVFGNSGAGSHCVLTITAMASGATDPDITTALAALGDDEFDWIVMPYQDSTNLGAMADYFNDISGSWSWIKALYGHCLTCHQGDVSTLQSFGAAQNRQHISYFPTRKFVSPPWEAVASVNGHILAHLQSAPELSRPLQTLELVGIKGPRLRSDQLTKTDRQTLYFNGVSGYHIARDGSVRIDRLLTGYRVNAWGDNDATYLDLNTMAQSMFGIRYLRQKVTNYHGRQGLADINSSNIPHICTPVDLKNTLIHGYADLVALGVFEGLDQFARDVVVERDATDANRMNASLPLDHVNQLRIVAVSAVNYMQRTEPRDALAA